MARVELTDQSLKDLLQRLSEQTANLVRKEIQLAQTELQEKGKRPASVSASSGVVD